MTDPIKARKGYLKSLLKIIILKLLSENPLHGYEIHRKIRQLTSGMWCPSFSLIYPILEELLESKLIEKEETMKGKKVLYIYSLTDAGYREYWELIGKYQNMVNKMIMESHTTPYRALPLLILTTRLGQMIMQDFPPSLRVKIIHTIENIIDAIHKKIRRLKQELL